MRKFTETIVQIKITTATVIDGLIVTPGTIVEMVEDEAKSMMRLGKAELHAVLEHGNASADDDGTDGEATQEAAAQAAAEATTAAADDEAAAQPTERKKARK